MVKHVAATTLAPMLTPLEAEAAAAVAPIGNAPKTANATAARAPAGLPMANQQTGARTTLRNPAGSTALHGAVDLKTGIWTQLVPYTSTATAMHTATGNNHTEQSHAVHKHAKWEPSAAVHRSCRLLDAKLHSMPCYTRARPLPRP